MHDGMISRRRLMAGVAATGAVALAAACPALQARAASVTVGIIYVGPRDDFGWNQSHAVAAEELKKVPGIEVVEEENVAETVAVQKTMESMIREDGATLILPTAFGYFDPFMLETARKFPDVQFRHAGGIWIDGKHPKNAGSYFGYLDQAHYVDGVAAGLSTRTGKLGFIGAKPITHVLHNINSFLLGARSVNPSVTVQVIFTGGWALPVREAEATNALVDAGCDVITCHVDSPKTLIQVAESRDVKTCGHDASQASLAPKGFITGAEYKWGTIYKGFATTLAAGGTVPNVVRGGFDLGYVMNTPYGAGATPEAIKAADAARKRLVAKAPIYVGPIKDNKGNVVVPAGAALDNYDMRTEDTDFLVDGVIGSVS